MFQSSGDFPGQKRTFQPRHFNLILLSIDPLQVPASAGFFECIQVNDAASVAEAPLMEWSPVIKGTPQKALAAHTSVAARRFG
jgi:hypothetical protein